MRPRSPAVVASLVFLLSLLPTMIVSSHPETREPTVQIWAGGRVLDAVPGLEIMQAEVTVDPSTGDTICAAVDYRAVIGLPPQTSEGRLIISADEHCVIRVTGFDFKTAEGAARLSGPFDPLGFAALAAVEHRIWARHIMGEYIDIWVTWVYQEFTYQEDSTLGAVWGATVYQAYCAHDNVGWSILSCIHDTAHNGDQRVERWTFGHFRNECCGGIEHTLEARPYAEVGWSWRSCTHTGALPAGWDLVCEFGQAY